MLVDVLGVEVPGLYLLCALLVLVLIVYLLRTTATDFVSEIVLVFSWTVVCSTARWSVPFELPVGFALVLPPAAGRLWARGKMPLLAVQVAQAASGTRSATSLATSLVAHPMGAAAAVALLRSIELQYMLEGLVPNPTLGEHITPELGFIIEASLLAYTIGLFAVFPNWLASKRIPRFLFFLGMFPAMRATKGLTGPSLQPAITIIVKLILQGPGAAHSALLPYLAGPIFSGLLVGMAVRGVRLPFQHSPGLPLKLAGLVTENNKKDE